MYTIIIREPPLINKGAILSKDIFFQKHSPAPPLKLFPIENQVIFLALFVMLVIVDERNGINQPCVSDYYCVNKEYN